jgi:NADH dehydrogenase FAD-containing subunit
LTPPEKVEELLSFVVVGGGPSGVEVAADLMDFVSEEAQELYPELVDKVKVTIVSIESQLLSTYSDTISKKSVEVFEEKGITVMRSHLVTGFTPDAVNLVRMSDGTAIIKVWLCCVVCRHHGDTTFQTAEGFSS